MTGIELIAAERKRQIEEEGWTAKHDADHVNGELTLAAICYAAPVRMFQWLENYRGPIFEDPWPWGHRYDKRSECGERRNNPGNSPPNPDTYTKEERLDLLVKAGALIAAEIDRLHYA